MYICIFTDERISTLSQQSLMSHLDHNTAQSLQLSLRLSTLEGVKYIYQQISEKKWNQVGCISIFFFHFWLEFFPPVRPSVCTNLT